MILDLIHLKRKELKIMQKRKEPIDPEIVLLGLILVSFLPLKIFPQTKPTYIRHYCN